MGGQRCNWKHENLLPIVIPRFRDSAGNPKRSQKVPQSTKRVWPIINKKTGMSSSTADQVSGKPRPTVEFLCVLDFEATCEEDPTPQPSPQEIIEFPSLLFRKALNEEGEPEYRLVDAFEAFVRPVIHPKLSDFCKALTTITQEQVDAADPFPTVLERHVKWLTDHGSFDENASFYFVTCGDWDFRTMLPMQMKASRISYKAIPRNYTRWINIKRVFDDSTGKKSRGMASMLKQLGIVLTGTHHRGIDDCRNIAKIVHALQERYESDFSKPTGGHHPKADG